MNAETISCLNFIVHSLVIGAAAWLLVRCIIRDALGRCILANLAVLMCLYSPFNIAKQDLLPLQKEVPVWPPIRETFKADWRISVAPASAAEVKVDAETRVWDVDEVVKVLRWLAWIVSAVLLMRLLVQCVRVQRWAWRLRRLTSEERELICGSASGFCGDAGRLESSRGLEHSRTLARVRVFEGVSTPCVAGWFFPVIAVPVSAFGKLSPRQWGWLLRHEGEHLRLHDTVAALLHKIIRAFLWWNPFVHGLIEEYSRDREVACDAAAVGEEREHTAYADFLLAWAAESAPQHSCVMPIAYSRPAKRLKVRLVALMEARGVRKKLGALSVVWGLAFAMVAPWIAASFGIATASAQAVVDAKADDGALQTRVYRVAPDFLSVGVTPADSFEPGKAVSGPVRGKTARELLEQKGVSFPAGASAIYNPTTSQLIVRNTKSNMEVMEGIIDALNQRPMMVHVTCKLVQADEFLGAHESILSSEDAQALIRTVSQKKGVELMSSPSVTMKFDQNAIVEVVQEVLPKMLPDGKLSGDLKFVGIRVELNAHAPAKGKSTVETKVNLGLDTDSDSGWLPQKDKAPDWDKVRLFSLAAKAALASGETLVLHLPTSKRPVTVLITAAALNPSGGNADSFSATMRVAPPASQGRDVAERKGTELVVREYRVPPGFGAGKKPAEYLEAGGVIFPPGAKAELKEGMLTVRNTHGNLDLIEALIESHLAAGMQKEGRVRLTVHAVEVKDDFDGLMALISTEYQRDPKAATVLLSALGHQFTLAGVLAEAQFQGALQRLKKSGSKTAVQPEAMVKGGKEAVFDLPAEAGHEQVKVTPVIGVDGNTVELTIGAANLNPGESGQITTAVTIWNGQVVMLARNPVGKEKTQRVLFISASLIDPAGEAVKK